LERDGLLARRDAHGALMGSKLDLAGAGRDRDGGSGAQDAEARAARLDDCLALAVFDAQHPAALRLVVRGHLSPGEAEPMHHPGQLLDSHLG